MALGAEAALRPEERVTVALRRLYEQYGYKKYAMGKFEEYDLYLENKNFLKSKHIITFNDLSGRVLALKPDVTLSIARHTRATSRSTEKFYYLENVYRLDPQSQNYGEIEQLGLEYLGKLDAYARGEVLELAAKTLSLIAEHSRMQLSHAGFALSLMDSLSVTGLMRHEMLACIRQKNRHELTRLAKRYGMAPAAFELVAALVDLCGDFEETLKRARKIAITQSMNDALDQLRAAGELLSGVQGLERVMLDFSLADDEDYYSGFIFRGYVEGVPRAVLAGGDYGNLMQKFGHSLDAIGFAVYLNELKRLYEQGERLDVDALILYEDDASLPLLAQSARALREAGLRVRVERSIPAELRYETLYAFEEGALREVTKHA